MSPEQNKAEKILSISGLTKFYGKIHAVDGLSAEVEKGQVFGILGPNGSGKTTTLSILLDLVRPTGGTFKWFGSPPSKESRKRIGSVIESPNFFPYLNATRNLKIIAEIKDMKYQDHERVLKIAGLFERRKDKFRTYSFGMKQRLAVASALLGNPEVLILDEPTNGLDPMGIAQIREIILDVAKQGITIIIASHLLDEVQKICSHVAVLNKGKMLFSGKVSDVLSISDAFELAAENPEHLKQAIMEHPLFGSLEPKNGMIHVVFKGTVIAGEINEFLYRKGVILSHLAEKRRTLEQHFLELLQDNV